MEITYDRKEAEIRSMAVNSCQQQQHTQQGSCRIDWRNTEHRIILEYLKEHLKEEDDLSMSPVFSLHSKNLGQSEHRAGAGSIIQFLRPHFQTHPTLLDVLPWRIVVGIPSCQNPSRSSIFCDNCGVAYSLHDNWYNCFIKLTLKDSIGIYFIGMNSVTLNWGFMFPTLHHCPRLPMSQPAQVMFRFPRTPTEEESWTRHCRTLSSWNSTKDIRGTKLIQIHTDYSWFLKSSVKVYVKLSSRDHDFYQYYTHTIYIRKLVSDGSLWLSPSHCILWVVSSSWGTQWTAYKDDRGHGRGATYVI